jgi:hypothetical protein
MINTVKSLVVATNCVYFSYNIREPEIGLFEVRRTFERGDVEKK